MLSNAARIETMQDLPPIGGHNHTPGFIFQKYHSNDAGIYPYEALAVLKNSSGTVIQNDFYFDRLRNMDEEYQIRIDRMLVPAAISQAVAKGCLPVAVNVHLATLVDLEFQQQIENLLEKLNLSRSQLMFEIVEPHAPTPAQAIRLKRFSVRTNEEKGFDLIIDDHNFDTGGDRLSLLAPFCTMLKTNLEHITPARMEFLKATYPHLAIVLERVDAKDRQAVFEKYKGVAVQGLD